MSKQPIFANIFGNSGFPVCSEEQKQKLESASTETLEWAKAHEHDEEGQLNHNCTCDLIIELLQPQPRRAAVIAAATVIARDIYIQKRAGFELFKALAAGYVSDDPGRKPN